METSVTLMIIALFWIVLVVADLCVSLVLKLTVKVPFRKAFRWGLLSLLVPPMVIAYGTLVERNRFEVKEVVLEFDGLPESFDGYRIIHISDLHARSYAKRTARLERAAQIINGLDADLIAFTGDLISLIPDEIDPVASSLSTLKAKDGVVSVLGNHDYGTYADTSGVLVDDLIAKEREMGWELLLNEHKVLHRGADSIVVIGVENTSVSHFFPSNGDLTKASEGTDGAFRIVLTHDPMHWESEILGQDYALTLSGHTHAMQLSFFGWSPSSLMFKHSDGLYTEDSQHLYINVGLGETLFPARIGARPEITLITLKMKHKTSLSVPKPIIGSPNGNEFAEDVPRTTNQLPNGNRNRGNVPRTRKIQSHKHKNGRFVSVICAVYLYLRHIMRNPSRLMY